MNILQKLQHQPPHIREIITWATVVILGLCLSTWFVISIPKRLKNFGTTSSPFSSIKTRIMTELNTPEIHQTKINLDQVKKQIKEGIKQLSEELKKANQATSTEATSTEATSTEATSTEATSTTSTDS